MSNNNTVDATLIKKPYQGRRFSSKEELKHYALCSDPQLGPHYFISNFFYLQHPTEGRQTMKPYKYQWEMIDAFVNYRNNIIMCGRQLGKTQTSAGYLLWYSIFNPDSYILVASKSQEDAIDVMHRIQFGYENLPDWLRPGAVGYQKKSVEWDNGSRIVSVGTTEKTGRGRSPSIIYSDELAFLRQSIAKEFWASIQPGLSTGGKCIVTSTPNMPDDQFAEIWHSANDRFDENGNELPVGKNGFHPLKYTWRAHPDRDENWKTEEIAKLASEERFMREHEVQFITFEETLISPIMLDKKQGVSPIRKSGEVRWYGEPKRGEIYVVTLDPAMGTGGDHSAIQVFEMPSMNQVAEWKDNKTIVENQVKTLKQIVMEIREKAPDAEIFWTFENNAMGEAVVTHLRNVGEEYIDAELVNEPKSTHRSKKGRKGFNTTNTKKNEACSKLKSWFEGDKMHIYSKPLLSELRAYIAKGVGYEAKLGYNDDLVSATLLFIRVAMFISKWDDRCYEATTYEYDDESNGPMPIMIM